jgi:hypothetical protein
MRQLRLRSARQSRPMPRMRYRQGAGRLNPGIKIGNFSFDPAGGRRTIKTCKSLMGAVRHISSRRCV